MLLPDECHPHSHVHLPSISAWHDWRSVTIFSQVATKSLAAAWRPAMGVIPSVRPPPAGRQSMKTAAGGCCIVTGCH